MSENAYVEVVNYDVPLLKGSSFLPEIVVGEYHFLPSSARTHLRMMPKEDANKMATEISSSLGIEAKLAK